MATVNPRDTNQRAEYRVAKKVGSTTEAVRERIVSLPKVTAQGLRDGVNGVRGGDKKR